MENKELKRQLTVDGYKVIREITGRGLCGLREFVFTIGLCYGLDKNGCTARYCYAKEDVGHAVMAISIWDGKDHPQGPWIKHKGAGIDESNPKNIS